MPEASRLDSLFPESLKFDFKFWDSDEEKTVVESVIDGQSAEGVDTVEVLYNKERDVVEGLYSVGEAACVSVHGANRLGANSLLDLVVFGRGTGKNIVEKHKNTRDEKLNIDEAKFYESLKSIDDLVSEDLDESTTGSIRTNMQEIMQKYASVYKSKDLLETGFTELERVLKERISIKDKGLVWNTDLLEALELKNMLSLAYLTIGASIFREESRGSHYRYDFPERDDKNWMYHTLSWYNNNNLKNEKSDVNFKGLFPDEMESIPPAKRVY